MKLFVQTLCLLLLSSSLLFASEKQINIVYTGKSLGALGVFREPRDHQLLVEDAQQQKEDYRFTRYDVWRAQGVSLFAQDHDLSRDELKAFLASHVEMNWQKVPALISGNAVLLQDATSDLLSRVEKNKRRERDFPDMQRGEVWRSDIKLPSGKQYIIVAEETAGWPTELGAWTSGELNVVTLASGSLYELPVNLSEIGPRAKLIADEKTSAEAAKASTLLVDLGMRDGDLGLTRLDRARLDYQTLTTLGYQLVVPFELELALGREERAALSKEFKGLQFLASNLKSKEKDVFVQSLVIEINGLRIGCLGMVDPEIKGRLSKKMLDGLSIEAPLDVLLRELPKLRAQNVDAIVVFSNMHPKDNALLSREGRGFDVLVADLHTRWSPEEMSVSVDLPRRATTRPGSPALMTRSFSNGLGLGVLAMRFEENNSLWRLSSLKHTLHSVTDRVGTDASLVASVQETAQAASRPRGSILVPTFAALLKVVPALGASDKRATDEGRITKELWEAFLAKLLRVRTQSEVGIVRVLPHFPPYVGALDEADTRSWLWTEENVVLIDIAGKDLKSIVKSELAAQLSIDGVSADGSQILGRPIVDDALYRVATTDLLTESTSFQAFSKASNKLTRFVTEADGQIVSTERGRDLSVRDYVLGELARLSGKDSDLAPLFVKSQDFAPLLGVRFDNITLFGSFSQSANNEPFASVPESRVTAADNFVLGISGNYLFSYDSKGYGFDLGFLTSFAQQVQRDVVVNGTPLDELRVETADDLRFDLKGRFKLQKAIASKPQPFLGLTYDTEFSPSVQTDGITKNPRQQDLRALAGVLLAPSKTWNKLQLSGFLQDDLSSDEVRLESGLELQANYLRKFETFGEISYQLRNDLRYFLPSGNDDATDLALRYNMIHELLLPFLKDISFSLAADFLFFQGKLPETDDLGVNAIFRVGLNYNRSWKPGYQSFW